MIINNILVTEEKNSIKLSAKITFDNTKEETIYFLVSKEYKEFLTNDATPFLAAFLLPCMKLGESIHIKDTVSKKILLNKDKIAKLFEDWKVGINNIPVKADMLRKDDYSPKAVGCFFSGGVDSFYTFLKNKDLVNSKQLSAEEKITHFILVHGFDIELENKKLFSQTVANINKIAKKTNVNVITVETNVRSLIESRLIWEFSHGGALASVALALRGGFKKIYIAGAVRKDQLFPYGTHPYLDPLWGTETISIVHDGTEHQRLQKIENYITKSPLALQYLRVCNQNRKGEYNCGKCIKCMRTMMELSCFISLKKVPAFSRPLDLECVKKMYYDYKLLYHLQGIAILEELRKNNREPELQNAIAESLERSKHPPFIRTVADRIAYIDRTYNKRRLYKYVFRMNNKQDRNILFKFLVSKGVIK